MKCFLWRVIKGGLPTNEFRSYRNMTDSTACPSCGSITETHLHALRDYDKVRVMWNWFGNRLPMNFLNLELRNWVEQNITIDAPILGETTWNILFGFVLSAIWEERNMVVFDGVTFNEYRVINSARQHMWELKK